MNITLTLDDNLVKRVRKIASDRETTLTGMVRDYLEQLAGEHARQKHNLKQLERSFERYQTDIGRPGWRREDLYEGR